jgi:ribosomal protein L40E
MIVCPNCKHDNPEGATNCEACYTALPATKACPSCGASIQLDATFCGQCGHNLTSTDPKSPILLPPPTVAVVNPTPGVASIGLPPTVLTNPEADLAAFATTPGLDPEAAPTTSPPIAEPDVNLAVEQAAVSESPPVATTPVPEIAPVEPPPVASEPEPDVPAVTAPPVATQLQLSAYQLLHLQTNTILEIPPHLQVLHLGKPNDRVPPDIDVSGFPCAEVVSRIHANIRLEGENYYIEDIGSANGTYINHNVLAKGNRHLLRAGDRIGLGKGDLVTLIFQSGT